MVRHTNGTTTLKKAGAMEEMFGDGREPIEDVTPPLRIACGNTISIKGTYSVECRVSERLILGNDNTIEISPEVKIVIISDAYDIPVSEGDVTEDP